MKILFVALLFTFTAAAQTVTGKDTVALTLSKTMELALKNNNDLKISFLNKSIADEKVSEAWGSAVMPDISGNINYRKALKKGVFNIEAPGFSGSFPVGTDNTMTASLNLEQPLFSGAAFIGIRVAQTYSDIAATYYESAKNELKVQVKQAYYSYLLAQEVVKLSKQNLTLAEDNLKNTQSLYRAGMISEYDLVRAGVQVQNLIPEIQSAENAVKVAENLIKLITGLNMENRISISDSLTYTVQTLSEFEDYYERIMQANPLIKGSELETLFRDDAVTARFAQHFPTLSLFGSWQTEAQEDDGRAFSNWRYNSSSSIGLTLKIPIFKGFQTSSIVEQAKLDYQIALENHDKTKRVLSNQLNDLMGTIERDKQRLEAYKAAINQADLAYTIAVKRYNTGLSTQLEVVDAMVSLTRAKVNYLTAIYDYRISLAKLDQLTAKD